MYTKIIGTGSYLPSQVRTNADLEKMVETSDECLNAGHFEGALSRAESHGGDRFIRRSNTALTDAGGISQE
jgi:3-oxoacyl-[acyl-carrier-protein] synthase III